MGAVRPLDLDNLETSGANEKAPTQLKWTSSPASGVKNQRRPIGRFLNHLNLPPNPPKK